MWNKMHWNEKERGIFTVYGGYDTMIPVAVNRQYLLFSSSFRHYLNVPVIGIPFDCLRINEKINYLLL